MENYTGFVFVVDTTDYSGNFERPLTAWCTGQLGECGVGKEEAEAFLLGVPDDIQEYMEKQIVSWPDDHGCCRPAAIWGTPGFWNDGSGDHWPDHMWGSEEVLKRWNEKDHPSFIKGPSRCTAYQSVGMLFNERPPDHILEFMMQRAYTFQVRVPRQGQASQDLVFQGSAGPIFGGGCLGLPRSEGHEIDGEVARRSRESLREAVPAPPQPRRCGIHSHTRGLHQRIHRWQPKNPRASLIPYTGHDYCLAQPEHHSRRLHGRYPWERPQP